MCIPSRNHSCPNVACTRKQQLFNYDDDEVVHDMQVAMTQANACRQVPRLVLLCLLGGKRQIMHGRHEARHPWMECQQWCWRWASSMRQRKNYWQRGVKGLTCQQRKYVATEQIMLHGPMRLASALNAPFSSYKLRTHVLWCNMS